MSAIESLQNWYLAQCDGNWEHRYGVTVGTLDNPGWSLEIDLVGTKLQSVKFDAVSYGVGANSEPVGVDWLVCKVEKNKFLGHGGPKKLEEVINVFLSWAKENA
jgi:hypothetical protein